MIDVSNALNEFRHFGVGLFMTLSPQLGEGMTESVIAILLVVTVCVMWILGKDVPELLKIAVTLIMGLYFGYQGGKNTQVSQ